MKNKRIESAVASLFLFFLFLSVPVPAAPAENQEKPWCEYDRNIPLKAEIISEKEEDGFRKVYFKYIDLENEEVPGVMTVPTGEGRKPPYPVVALLHGYMQDKENFIFAALHKPFAKKGLATIAIDFPSHGDRPGHLIDDYNSLDGVEAAFRQAVLDVLRLFDYIGTREELDADRIGYFGISMGAITGAIACGVDERVKAMVFALGGGGLECLFKHINVGGSTAIREIVEKDPDAARERFALLDPLQYIKKISPRPVMFFNAEDDAVVRKECAENFHNAVTEPKKIIWRKVGGHVILPGQIKSPALEWYEKYLVENHQPADQEKR